MNDIRVFAGSIGLDTVADPVRVRGEKDIVGLQAAVNVSIDATFRVNRRKGLSLIQSGVFHSLYKDFVVKGTSLYRINSDLSTTGIRSGLTDAWMSYEQIGERTYYTNSHELGYVHGNVSYTWSKGTYQGPDTNRVFSGPITGSHLAFAMARMFISEGNVVWWSEPYDVNLYNKAESFFQFPSKIRMLKGVDEGLFISTETDTWFCRGVNPLEMTATKVAPFPAFEWTDAADRLPGIEIGLEDPRLCVFWASPEGAMAGTPTGAVVNLNKRKIIYPESCSRGFGCLIGYNFIHRME